MPLNTSLWRVRWCLVAYSQSIRLKVWNLRQRNLYIRLSNPVSTTAIPRSHCPGTELQRCPIPPPPRSKSSIVRRRQRRHDVQSDHLFGISMDHGAALLSGCRVSYVSRYLRSHHHDLLIGDDQRTCSFKMCVGGMTMWQLQPPLLVKDSAGRPDSEKYSDAIMCLWIRIWIPVFGADTAVSSCALHSRIAYITERERCSPNRSHTVRPR